MVMHIHSSGASKGSWRLKTLSNSSYKYEWEWNLEILGITETKYNLLHVFQTNPVQHQIYGRTYSLAESSHCHFEQDLPEIYHQHNMMRLLSNGAWLRCLIQTFRNTKERAHIMPVCISKVITLLPRAQCVDKMHLVGMLSYSFRQNLICAYAW